MGKLCKKLLLLGLPFLAWLVVYLVWDPFFVLRSYQGYQGQAILPSRDYMATDALLQNYKAQKYDSFILGNSRTLGFRARDWAAHLPAQASIFSYGSNSDNLFGIAGKVELIDSLGLQMRDVLLLLDNTSVIGTQDDPAYFLRKHPRVSHVLPVVYQSEMARAFFQIHTFEAFFHHASLQGVNYAPVTCEMILAGPELALACDEDAYYRERPELLSWQPELQWGSAINSSRQFQLLEKMAAVFRAHHTRLRVLIPPQHQAIRLNPRDVASLCKIFGESCVFDFSSDSDINRDSRNWYDAQHFRPRVGRRLLREIYGARWLK